MVRRLSVYLAMLVLGLIIGREFGPRAEPVSVPKPPVAKSLPDPEVGRLQGELERALRELESARAGVKAVSSAAPADVPLSAAVPDKQFEQLGNWVRELKNILRVKDALGLTIPKGDPMGDRLKLHAVLARARELLKDDAAQIAFLSDLPTLNDRELTMLWDVLWLSERDTASGFLPYGAGFARQVSQSLFQQTFTLPEGNRRMMMANLLLPDTRSLSDLEIAQLRTLLESSKDPILRRKITSLPDRGR